MSKTAVEVAIIGLNHMTGSIGLALRKQNDSPNASLEFTVSGQDGDKDVMIAAKHFGAVDNTISNTQAVVRNAHIVIVDLPESLMKPVYEYFSPGLKGGAVVLDMSVNKTLAQQLADEYFPDNTHLIGIRPIVSNAYLYSSERGMTACREDLFRAGDMIISPSPKAPPEAIKLATDLAEILGMEHRFVAPEEYEGIANFTERLPLFLAYALFASADGSHSRVDLMRMINQDMGVLFNPLKQIEAADLVAAFMNNPQDTNQRLGALINVLQALQEMLDSDDEKAKETAIRETLKQFYTWEGQRDTGNWDDIPKNIDANPRSRFFGGLFGRN